jgi:hypothetical protein
MYLKQATFVFGICLALVITAGPAVAQRQRHRLVSQQRLGLPGTDRAGGPTTLTMTLRYESKAADELLASLAPA